MLPADCLDLNDALLLKGHRTDAKTRERCYEAADKTGTGEKKRCGQKCANRFSSSLGRKIRNKESSDFTTAAFYLRKILQNQSETEVVNI